jgi:hypothetical protein
LPDYGEPRVIGIDHHLPPIQAQRSKALAKKSRTFHTEVNRFSAERDQQNRANRQRLTVVERKIAGIVGAIEDGTHSRELGDRLVTLAGC